MIDDRIDQSISYWNEFHVDGTLLQYYAHKVQSQDVINKYFPLPPNIIGVGKLFDVTSTFMSSDIFSLTYQIAMSDVFFNMQAIEIAPYWLIMQNLQQLQQILIGQKPIRFSRYEGLLHVDMDWGQVAVGNYLVIEAYAVNDPSTNPLVWNDVWLQRYATAQIKKNWGEVLSKYTEMPLTGGLKVDGHRLLTEAQAEIDKLEQQMVDTFSIPMGVLVG